MAPIVLVPGLCATPIFYAAQIPLLWRYGPVQVANHTRGDTMSAIAASILDEAPRHFVLVGHSMGGYIAFELLRKAPERIERVAFLDTSARADTPEQTARRLELIALAMGGRYDEIVDLQFDLLVHPAHRGDVALREHVRAMACDAGADVFIRQQHAIIGRGDSRQMLANISGPALVLVGEQDEITPPARATEIADGIRGAARVVVPRCGHMSAMEQPEAVNDALSGWLARFN